MFHVGDTVELLSIYPGLWALSSSKRYRVTDVNTRSCCIMLNNDNGTDEWFDQNYFKEVPCGGLYVGWDVRPVAAFPLPYGFVLHPSYRVIDTNVNSGEILLENDTGLRNWHDHRGFEPYHPPKTNSESFSISSNYDNECVKDCSCDMRDLMMYGCRCGGFESEQKQKKKEVINTD